MLASDAPQCDSQAVQVEATTLLGITVLLVGCARPPRARVEPPANGICFEFEHVVDGELPTGFRAESPVVSTARPGLRAAPVLGVDDSGALALRTPSNAEGAAWLVGARFQDASIAVDVRPLDATSRLGVVLAPGYTPAFDAAFPARRLRVVLDAAARAVLLLEDRGRIAREIARLGVSPSPAAWRRLVVRRRSDAITIEVDGVELGTMRVLEDEREPFGFGLFVRGAGAFDRLWIH